MPIIGTIYEDVTTDVIGLIGSWQWFVTFICTVLTIPALFNHYDDIFMLHPEEVVCVPPQRVAVFNTSLCFATIENNGTDVVKCSKWHVKLMWLIWLKKSWLVFCDQESKVLSTAMICRFGLIFGCVIFGLVSDSFGRKTAFTVNVFSTTILEIILTFCDSEAWFRLFIFLKSLFGSANLFIGLLLICEIASNKWRSTLITIVITPRLVAMVCVVPLANYSPNMETFGFLATLFYIGCSILLRWCPESPQWLLYNRKIKSAEQILKRAAKTNGIRLCEDFKIRPINHRAYNCLDETTSCVGVITTPNIRTIFIVTSTFWAIYYFLWSSLYVRVYSMERIVDLLLKVSCFVGVFGCLTIIASKKLELRRLLMIHVILTGVSTIFLIFVRKSVVRIMVSSVAISAGILVHALILNMIPRLFAINIRGSALGCFHAIGQLGSAVSYILFLFKPMGDVAFLVVAVLATASLAGLCLVLPSVDGRELPDIMEDMDYYSELTKPLRWATQKTSSPSIEEVQMRVYSFGSGRTIATRSHSEARVPPQRIGFATLWRTISVYLRIKCTRT